jgi:hypothetical protein
MSRPFWLRARALPHPAAGLRAAAPAEERLEEVRERILGAEDLVHLFFRHRPVAAARAAHVDRPGAPLAAAAERAAAKRRAARPAALLLGLLVHPPVRAQLVVLLPLLGIAEHLVRLVDLLELRLGDLVTRVDVRVVLAGELPVRLLQLLVRSGLRDPERLVVVLEFHS